MTHINKLAAAISFALLVLTISCADDDDDQDPQNNGSAMVYLAGSGYFGDGYSPCYWKDDMAVNLEASFGGDAFSIDVSGSDIYVGGRTWTNNAQTHFVPAYWKNGTLNELPLPYDKPMCTGIVTSIEVSNGVVYAAGFYSDSLPSPVKKWLYQPCIWKSSEDEPIPLEPLDKLVISGQGWWGRAESLETVSSGNKTGYCVAGNSSGPEGFTDPCYWTVGMDAVSVPQDEIEAEPLSTMGFGGSALAVAGSLDPKFQGDISQTELVFAGYVYDANEVNVPCYWSGGNRKDLSKINPIDHGVATAITLSGGSVLVAGYTHNNEGESIPCLWEGSNRTDLPLPVGAHGGKATAIASDNEDVYVAGTISMSGTPRPCYWKNGEIVQITTEGEARAMSLRN
jgi:hypothetical protein